MTKELIQQAAKTFEAMGPSTRAFMICILDHDCQVKAQFNGQVMDLVFVQKSMDIIITKMLDKQTNPTFQPQPQLAAVPPPMNEPA